MVSWSTITRPKDRGGLGLYQMQYRNQAILAKLCWRLANESEAPWAKMLAKKYLTTRRLTEEGRNLPCSRICVACKKGGPIYVKGLRWLVKNGQLVNLWNDFWLPNGTLRSLIEGPLSRAEDQMMLHQCFDTSTGWNLQNCLFVLPDQIVQGMNATLFSCDPNAEDSLLWAYSKNGSFSLNSTYLLARGLKPFELGHYIYVWDLENYCTPSDSILSLAVHAQQPSHW